MVMSVTIWRLYPMAPSIALIGEIILELRVLTRNGERLVKQWPSHSGDQWAMLCCCQSNWTPWYVHQGRPRMRSCFLTRVTLSMIVSL